VNVTPLAAREAGASPNGQRRALRRPSLSHILIAVAVLLAFLFNFLALQDRTDSTLVAVATGDLAAGVRVTADDIRFVPVAADFEGLGSLVGEAEWSEREGWVLTRSLDAGSVVDLRSLGEPTAGEGLRSMSIPIAIENAAGGLLVTGDIVDVVSVSDGVASFVAEGIDVVSVAPGDSGGIGSIGNYHVVLSVSAEQALSLAEAIDSGSVEIIRSTGAAEVGG
jgi:Flp pilus assembly protein CpaB